jgi:hypothetical protein
MGPKIDARRRPDDVNQIKMPASKTVKMPAKWEEVYNASVKTKGNPLGGERHQHPRLPNQEGFFYQTYGGGGGPGGSGGYWAMRITSGQHTLGVWEVKGNEFGPMLEAVLEFRPEDSWRGIPAAVKLLPLTH